MLVFYNGFFFYNHLTPIKSLAHIYKNILSVLIGNKPLYWYNHCIEKEAFLL